MILMSPPSPQILQLDFTVMAAPLDCIMLIEQIKFTIAFRAADRKAKRHAGTFFSIALSSALTRRAVSPRQELRLANA